MAAETKPGDICSFLLWARANGFRVREVAMRGVRLVVDDLRPLETVHVAEKAPRTVHEAWAKQLGVEMPPEDDDEDGEARAS